MGHRKSQLSLRAELEHVQQACIVCGCTAILCTSGIYQHLCAFLKKIACEKMIKWWHNIKLLCIQIPIIYIAEISSHRHDKTFYAFSVRHWNSLCNNIINAIPLKYFIFGFNHGTLVSCLVAWGNTRHSECGNKYYWNFSVYQLWSFWLL